MDRKFGKKLQKSFEKRGGRFGIAPDTSPETVRITEQGSIADQSSVFESIAEMRDLGLRFALDDVGVAYSHLPFMDKIQPAFLKISQHFGTAFETDSTKMKIVMNLRSLSNDFGCHLILEGIEQRQTADIATSLGIEYGQGFLFGHPGGGGDLQRSSAVSMAASSEARRARPRRRADDQAAGCE